MKINFGKLIAAIGKAAGPMAKPIVSTVAMAAINSIAIAATHALEKKLAPRPSGDTE